MGHLVTQVSKQLQDYCCYSHCFDLFFMLVCAYFFAALGSLLFLIHDITFCHSLSLCD
jgi:hypothetical protein